MSLTDIWSARGVEMTWVLTGVNNRQCAHPVVLAAGCAKLNVVSTVVVDTSLGQHGVVLNLRFSNQGRDKIKIEIKATGSRFRKTVKYTVKINKGLLFYSHEITVWLNVSNKKTEWCLYKYILRLIWFISATQSAYITKSRTMSSIKIKLDIFTPCWSTKKGIGWRSDPLHQL